MTEPTLFLVLCWIVIVALIPATLKSIVRILALFAWLGILAFRRTFNLFPPPPPKNQTGPHLILLQARRKLEDTARDN